VCGFDPLRRYYITRASLYKQVRGDSIGSMRTLTVALLFMMALVSPAFAKKKPAGPTAVIVEINALSITVSIGKSGEDHETYKITKDTKITLDGAPTTTDSILAGMVAQIKASETDPTVAVSIAAKDAPKK
jgi:hypothetical protein